MSLSPRERLLAEAREKHWVGLCDCPQCRADLAESEVLFDQLVKKIHAKEG